MRELITICVPTCARPSLLLHTLHSCFIQDYRPLEIDIRDDSKADDTARLIESLQVPEGIQVRYFANHPGLGQAANVNRLFAEARGNRLILLHDDDTLLPGAVSALADALDASPRAVAAYGRQHVLLSNGERSPRDTDVHNTAHHSTLSFVGVRATPLTRALWLQFPNNGYLVCSGLARQIGYLPFPIVGEAGDADFAIRLAQQCNDGEFAFIDQVTSEYRLSTGSLRAKPYTSFKFYKLLEQLEGLSPEEAEARDWLLRKTAPQAVAENAIHGHRREALRIFLSKAYAPSQSAVKTAYHLGLIAIPKLASLRRVLTPA